MDTWSCCWRLYWENGIANESGVRIKHELVVVIVGDGSYLFVWSTEFSVLDGWEV